MNKFKARMKGVLMMSNGVEAYTKAGLEEKMIEERTRVKGMVKSMADNPKCAEDVKQDLQALNRPLDELFDVVEYGESGMSPDEHIALTHRAALLLANSKRINGEQLFETLTVVMEIPENWSREIVRAAQEQARAIKDKRERTAIQFGKDSLYEIDGKCGFQACLSPIFRKYYPDIEDNYEATRLMEEHKVLTDEEVSDPESCCCYVDFKSKAHGEAFIERLNQFLTTKQEEYNRGL